MKTHTGGIQTLTPLVVVAMVCFLSSLGFVVAQQPSVVPPGTPHHPGFVESVDDLPVVQVVDKTPSYRFLPPVQADVDIIELLQQLDEALILGYLENLTGFGPRVTGEPACDLAGQYLYATFLGFGLAVRYHNYSGSVAGSNIEATLYGTQNPSLIYLICAHYDSVPTSPGADDDGSGVAAVLAAAQLMSQYEFAYTVRFVTFSGEEQGLVGSHYYAQEAYQNNDSIVAVLNADMIGYTELGEDGHKGKIFQNSASEWIVTYTQQISDIYDEYIDIDLLPQGESWGSDHYSFWQVGYDAVFYHEYRFNAYYHSSGDTIEHMNLTYSTHFSRLILATLASMALEPQPLLRISEITGSLGVHATITNIGDVDAENISVTMRITGGLLRQLNRSTTATGDVLLVHQSLSVKALLFRFGPIAILVTAEASNAGKAVQQATGFVVGPFVLRVTNQS